MRKQDAAILIDPATKRLKEAFPQYAGVIDETRVYLVSNRNRIGKRSQIADEIAARHKTDLSDTAGEALIGDKGCAVVLYYQNIREYDFTHFLFHEFGHVLSFHACNALFSETQEDADMDRDTPLRSGMALWSEIVAEVVAYRTEDAEPQSVSWGVLDKMEALIDEAVNAEIFDPYPFAFYCAMFFEDPTAIAYLYRNPNAAIGTNHCDDEIMPYIEAALSVIAGQLGRKEYWIIDRNTLCALGKCVDDLWSYCWQRYVDRRMTASMSRLRGLVQGNAQ